MNRRGFLVSAAGVAAVAALPLALASKPDGLRITTSNPPEPGFEYMGNRRFQTYCNGVPVSGGVVRADTVNGVAWRLERDAEGFVRIEGDSPVEEPVYGKITLVQLPNREGWGSRLMHS